MSSDPEHAHFADGVHENILTNLALDENVELVSRETMLAYRDTEERLSAIAEELGVRYLVEGSVRRSGDQVRIMLQLLDAESGNHIWADSYSRSIDRLAETEAEVAREVGRQIANRN
jgi:adenylate cyclase